MQQVQKSFFSYYEFLTPLGQMVAISSLEQLYLLDFVDSKHIQSNILKLSAAYNISYNNAVNEVIANTILQIEEYFAGVRQVFDIPIAGHGTKFQQQVLHMLARIPYGQVITYQQQAQAMGCPGSYRAVANANSRNLIAIILPCHRVIGANGQLTGYAGGLERKKYLLTLEKNAN